MEEIGCTSLISHSIITTDEIPIRTGPDNPGHEKVLEDEVQKLLDSHIIRGIVNKFPDCAY